MKKSQELKYICEELIEVNEDYLKKSMTNHRKNLVSLIKIIEKENTVIVAGRVAMMLEDGTAYSKELKVEGKTKRDYVSFDNLITLVAPHVRKVDEFSDKKTYRFVYNDTSFYLKINSLGEISLGVYQELQSVPIISHHGAGLYMTLKIDPIHLKDDYIRNFLKGGAVLSIYNKDNTKLIRNTGVLAVGKDAYGSEGDRDPSKVYVTIQRVKLPEDKKLFFLIDPKKSSKLTLRNIKHIPDPDPVRIFINKIGRPEKRNTNVLINISLKDFSQYHKDLPKGTPVILFSRKGKLAEAKIIKSKKGHSTVNYELSFINDKEFKTIENELMKGGVYIYLKRTNKIMTMSELMSEFVLDYHKEDFSDSNIPKWMKLVDLRSREEISMYEDIMIGVRRNWEDWTKDINDLDGV